MPMPLDLVVKKVLNSWSAFSAEIPTPQSFTTTSTWCASTRCDRITSDSLHVHLYIASNTLKGPAIPPNGKSFGHIIDRDA
jgi:hypothetical protein